MPKITIKPEELEDYKSPLYRYINGVPVYRLLPETTADQVELADGRNTQTAITKLDADVNTAQQTADKGVDDAAAAQATASTAKTIADTAKAKADTSVQVSGNQEIAGVKTFSSSPVIPTPAETDNSTKAATTAFVRAVVSALINSAPETLDTLKELADALGNDPNFATTVATQIGNVATTANTAKTTADSALAKANQAISPAIMTGASATANGQSGLVPAPLAGNQNRFLRGDGSWSDISQAFSPSIAIYLDKNGSDNNAGTTSSSPVLSINKAFEIADKYAGGRGYINISLRFGPGEWGDIVINSKPYVITITNYDASVAESYSTTLPKFGNITINNSYVVLSSFVANKITSQFGAQIYIEYGYKRLSHLHAMFNGFIYVRSVNVDYNILEIYSDNDNVTESPIAAASSGSINFGNYLHIRLGKSITSNRAFIESQAYGSIFIPYTITYDNSSYTWTGRKYNVFQGGSIYDGQIGKNLSHLNNVPGTVAGLVDDGAIVNGFQWGGALGSEVIHATGNSEIAGNLTFTAGNLFFENSSVPANGKPSVATSKNIYFTNASNKNIAYLRNQVDPDGARHLYFMLCDLNGDPVGHFRISGNLAGTELVAYAPSPPATDNQASVATTEWTRARIASATGKGATAFSTYDNIATIGTLSDSSDACAWSIDMITPDMQKAAYNAVKDNITARIFAGFIFEINNKEYHFTYDLYDQQNIADNAILALNGKEEIDTFARDEDGTLEEITVSKQTMLALHKYGAVNHKKELMKEKLTMQNNISLCESRASLENLLSSWGLRDSYENYMNSYIQEYKNMDLVLNTNEQVITGHIQHNSTNNGQNSIQDDYIDIYDPEITSHN